MFVQSVEFIRAHASGNGNGGKARSDISIYGQESNYTTWRLARMNLAIRGIDGQIAHGDSFHSDRFPDLKADYILANPPFNVSDWRGEQEAGEYADVPGFCKSATLEEIRKHGHVLTPGRYVGAEAQEDDGEPFEEKMRRLTATLLEQMQESARLDAAIVANMKELEYGG
jgi:type I restriction-modification system DNA methylase subunit